MTKEKETFYEECARILGVEYNWVEPPYKRPNRWNNRMPGNGRFPGYGCILMHGNGSIHVMLREPIKVQRQCKSEEEVYTLLRSIKGSDT